MTTLTRFGVPTGSGRASFVQPKVKWKYRVRVINFGPIAGGADLTGFIHNVSRPKWNQPAVDVHMYNSVAYYGGKTTFGEVSMTLRDDVTNTVSRLVGHQKQKQMNHFAQTTPLAAQNYKFQMYIETLDGGDDVILEQWFLEGCFLTDIDYDTFDWSANDPMMITLTVRADNATQSGGLMTDAPEIIPGVLLG